MFVPRTRMNEGWLQNKARVAGNFRREVQRRNRFEGWVVRSNSFLRLLTLGKGHFKNYTHKRETLMGTCAHKVFLGELYSKLFPTWLILCVTSCPDIWSDILSLSGRVFLHDIWIGRMNKADCPPQGRWAPSSQFKAWVEQKGWLSWE